MSAARTLGLLWRPELAGATREWVEDGRLGFVEVIAESLGGELPPDLAAVREAGVRVVPHGVALGIGGADPPDPVRLARLADAAVLCGAPLVSEHLAFVRAGGMEAGHLLPVPRTRAALDTVVDNIRFAIEALPVRLALEPIATLVEWPDPELTELAFLLEILDRTDVDLVLDVANIHVNAANRRRAGMTGPDADSMTLVDGLPLDRVAYVHAAGGRVVDGRHHDTHTDPLWPEVEQLVEELWSRHEIPGLLLERDGNFPAEPDLAAELTRLETAAERGRSRRRPHVLAPVPSAPMEGTGARTADFAGFLRAVSGDGPTPAGFDPDDLAAVAQVLATKRAEAVAHAVPDVAALPAFADRFVPWARRHPLRGGADADAVAFLRSLPRTERTVYACLAAARIRPGLHVWRSREAIVVGGRLGPLRFVRAL